MAENLAVRETNEQLIVDEAGKHGILQKKVENILQNEVKCVLLPPNYKNHP